MDDDDEILDDSKFYEQLLDVFLIWDSRSLFDKIFNPLHPLHNSFAYMSSSHDMNVKSIVFIACMQHAKVSKDYSYRRAFFSEYIVLAWL